MVSAKGTEFPNKPFINNNIKIYKMLQLSHIKVSMRSAFSIKLFPDSGSFNFALKFRLKLNNAQTVSCDNFCWQTEQLPSIRFLADFWTKDQHQLFVILQLFREFSEFLLFGFRYSVAQLYNWFSEGNFFVLFVALILAHEYVFFIL